MTVANNAVPSFSGIGYAMFLVSFFVGIYYTMIIAWAFYFTFASFARDVPWKTCDNEWNSPGMSAYHRVILFGVYGRSAPKCSFDCITLPSFYVVFVYMRDLEFYTS